MSGFFLSVINMSISASWIVLAVLFLRLLLKKAPKWIVVLLWGIVAIKLICPLSIESVMSLIPSAETISPEIMMENAPTVNTGIPVINDVVNPVIGESFAPDPGASVNPLQILIPILSVVWIVGIVVMLIYTVVSYFRVKSKIGTAVLFRDNIFQSEGVVSPFVLGVLKPKIYLPFNINEQNIEYVIAHENAHIRRKDYLWKPFGFLVLTLHWFNPLMWLSYVLLCRDIELACDEKVIRNLDTEQKADYSQALLMCSVNRRMIAACPLAFGELGVRDRVRSVLSYKRPALWIVIIAVISSITVAVCFLTNPSTSDKTDLLLDVLNNKKTFINESGEEVYFQDHKAYGGMDVIPEKYTFIDLDRDGKQELVVYITPDIGGYTVFHIYNDKVYGFDFGERQMVDLKTDGSFSQSEGAAYRSYVTLNFEKEKYQIVEQVYANDIEKIYRVNGTLVTGENAKKYIDEFNNKPSASWKAASHNQNQEFQIIYKQFIEGEKTALDQKGVAKSFEDYVLKKEYEYAYLDMTGDGIPELCVDTIPEMYFFTIENGKLKHWYTEASVYGKLLNNGAILRERHGGAPEHINYEYYELDKNAKVQNSIAFSWYEETTFNGKVYAQRYGVNGREVTKEEYERIANQYLTIGTDKIRWYDKN